MPISRNPFKVTPSDEITRIHQQNNPIYSFIWVYLFFWFLTATTEFLIGVSGAGSFEGFKDATITCLLWLIPFMLFPHHAKKIAIFLGVLVWFAALPGFGYFLIYRQELTQSLMFIIFESNQAESSEYFQNYFSVSVLIGFVLFSIIPILIASKIKNIEVNRKKSQYMVPVILCLVFVWPTLIAIKSRSISPAIDSIREHLGVAPPWQLGLGYLNYQRELKEVTRNLLDMNKIPALKDLTESEKNTPTNVVIVIGESTNRLHMGLYGYPRDTNPKLGQIKNELTVFNNVFASRPNTIESLEQVLTFADQKHPDDYKTKPSLIAMMKQAGYKTFWISNQQTLTQRNTMLTTFAKQTDSQVFLNTTRKQNAYSYDEKVLIPFKDKLKDAAQKKCIVVHLLGTHMKYSYRYPKSDAFFSGNVGLPTGLNEKKIKMMNDYDNAIRYNDKIIYQLIQQLKEAEKPSLLVYFSDHGDDVFDSAQHDFQGRNEAKPTYPMYAVPFIVWHSTHWFNQEALNNPRILNRQYDNGDFIHTWSDLIGLNYQGYRPQESIINDRFLEDRILVGDPYEGHLIKLEGTRDVPYPEHDLP